ncbi:hypothetical protein tb265_44770 [Gemmatimonadetes bacterium T265]|nr:hypothetical protein tb265_44770 [Gemmatimonadetes bacterium T265]
MRRSFLASAALAAFPFVTTSVSVAAAQIAPGSTLTFTGTADATDIGLPGVILDFMPRIVAASSGNTGTFASLNRRGGPGVSGHIDDIRVGNGPQSLSNFVTLGGYRFTLGALPSGTFGQDACYVDPAPGQTCTPYQSVQGDPSVNDGLSPFYVANLASGNPNAPINSVATFGLLGTVTGPGGTTSNFFGTISSYFVGLPYQVVLYTLEQQGLQGLTFTGTFVAGAPIGRVVGNGGVGTGVPSAVVPEPSTYALVGAGLVAVAGLARRRRA